jgi:cobalamin biosynthesis protein CobT
MSKNKKIVNILMASILFITFNFLFILNGCSNSNSTDTVVEESQSDVSDEEDASAANAGETTVSEDSAEETSVSENDEDANDTSSEEDPNSLKNIYQRFIESGKPSILVFSYDADCCAATKAFFDDYNGTAKKILEEYNSKFNTLFINTGILDKNNMNTVIEIASQNKVLNLPSILILDKTGKAYKVIEGPFDEIEAKKVLDGMLDD